KRREANTCDIFITTSHTDNQPVALIEAWAMGLPVVATAVGGVPDMVQPEETGLLVPDGDDAAMAAAILRLVAEPVLASRLSERGRLAATLCSSENILPRWAEIFKSVARRCASVKS